MPLQGGYGSVLVSYGAFMINSDSAQPPYRQLAAILRGKIAAGEITARLPGERALADEYQVAMGTVRKAIAVLRDEDGIVETTPGWGTYVKPQQRD